MQPPRFAIAGAVAVLLSVGVAWAASAQPAFEEAAAPPFPQVQVVQAAGGSGSARFTPEGELLFIDGYGAHQLDLDGVVTDTPGDIFRSLGSARTAFSNDGQRAGVVLGLAGVGLIDLDPLSFRELRADPPWQPPPGDEMDAFEPPHEITALQFDPTGGHLAAMTRAEGVRVISLASETERTMVLRAEGPFALAPGGGSVAIAWTRAGMVSVGTVEGRVHFVLPGEPVALAFSPDGARLAVTHSAGVSVIDPTTGALIQSVDIPQSARIERFDDRGLFVSTREDHVAWLYDGLLGTVLGRFESPHLIGGAAFDVITNRAALGLDRLGLVLVGHSDEQPNLPSSPTPRPFAPTFSADGRSLVWGSPAGSPGLWNLEERRLERWFEGSAGWPSSVRFGADGGQVAAAYGNGTVRFWNRATGQLETELTISAPGHGGADISPDLSLVAVNGGTGDVNVFSVADGSPVMTLPDAGDGGIGFGPTGATLITSWITTLDGGVRWDLDGNRLGRLLVRSAQLGMIRVSPTADRVLGRDISGGAVLWDPALESDGVPWGWGDFTPDGGTLVGAGQVLSVATDAESEPLARITSGLAQGYVDVRVSPDGRRYAAVALNGHCEIWSAEGPQLELTLHAGEGGEWAVRGRDGVVHRGHGVRPVAGSPQQITLNLDAVRISPAQRWPRWIGDDSQ